MTADFIGWRQFAFGELRKGHLALWDPRLFCGTPFFGDFQSAILYPPNWLFLVLPLPFALNLNIVLHVFLAGWFTSLWILKRGSHPLSALMAAFMFMFGGAYFLHIVPGHLPNLCAMVWIPLVFLAVDAYRKERAIRWILLGMAAFTLQIFSGHIQYTYYTGMVVGLYAALTLTGMEKKFSFLSGIVVMGAGAGLLAAFQILVGWDAAWDSLRGQRLPIGIVDIADMTPERLWCLLMPNFFGSWQNYWGGGFYWEGATFVSLTAFVLALYAFKISPDPQKKVFGGISLFLVVLAVGTRTPLFILFYKYFPLFGSFRGVSKVNILITLFLGALAAMAMDEILKDPQKLRGLAKITGIGGMIIFFIAFAFELGPHLSRGKLFGVFQAHDGQMMGSLVLCGILLGLLSLLSLFAQKRPALRYGFVILPCLELFWFAHQNLPSLDYRALLEKVSLIQKTYQQDPGDYRVLIGDQTALETSALDIWGEDPVIPARYAAFMALTQHCDPNWDFLQKFNFRAFPPAMGLLRLRYIFMDEGDHYTVQRTGLKEAPRAFLTDHWEVLGKEEIFQRVSGQGFDPLKGVLLESLPGLNPQDGKLKSRLSLRDLSTDQIEVEVELSKPAILIITDNYSKDWKTKSLVLQNQTAYPVFPANGFQRGIPLSEGSHHFLLEYRPALFDIGKWVSILAWAVFLILLVLKRKRT
jgi:hypothetical protein